MDFKNTCFTIVKAMRSSPSNIELGEVPATLDLSTMPHVHSVSYLNRGAYCTVWLVKLHQPMEIASSMDEPSFSRRMVSGFIIRLPGKNTKELPRQITNEVGVRNFVSRNLPHIPVPQVYLYEATDSFDTSFVVEEYIDSPPVSHTWYTLTGTQKESIANQMAIGVVDMASQWFPVIGGFDPTGRYSAPALPGCKVSTESRSSECYNVGPYTSIKEYFMSNCDRQIDHYTHILEGDSPMDRGYDENGIATLLAGQRAKRDAVAAAAVFAEPFVLMHGDIHGRNILADGDKIKAIIGWGFAGTYPLSDTFARGMAGVVDVESDEDVEEEWEWAVKIRGYIRDELRKRQWDSNLIDLLLGPRGRDRQAEPMPRD
ncbi:hypothetical protein F4777DRAFT_535136 [Nemania sp. FL0916]|nr:hypothetical protein F4777DRAFT_535136 [Nemania sp. FL0916]